MDSQVVSQLNPLSQEEMKFAKEILQKEKSLASSVVWNHISLLEPPKLAFLSKKLDLIDRRALVVLIDSVPDKENPQQLATVVYEAVISLTKKCVESWKIVPNVQPTLSPDDCYLAEEIALKDPQIIFELKKRGIEDLSLVSTDMFSPSYCQESYGDDPSSLRLVQLFFYTRMFKGDNEWAHPLDVLPFVTSYF
jgi:primary-amine oxidase